MNSKLLSLLTIAENRIIKQGDGCYDRMGACYKNKNKRDVISALCPPQTVRWNTYGVVSADEQRYLVRAIAKRHSVDIERANDRVKFVKFLQDLQDAHDLAFDPFNEVSGDRMVAFLENCDTIRSSLNKD